MEKLELHKPKGLEHCIQTSEEDFLVSMANTTERS